MKRGGELPFPFPSPFPFPFHHPSPGGGGNQSLKRYQYILQFIQIQRNWSFVSNYILLRFITLDPDVVDLWYFKLWLFVLTIIDVSFFCLLLKVQHLDPAERSCAIITNNFFLIPTSLQPGDVNLWYFKL